MKGLVVDFQPYLEETAGLEVVGDVEEGAHGLDRPQGDGGVVPRCDGAVPACDVHGRPEALRLLEAKSYVVSTRLKQRRSGQPSSSP